MFQIAFQCAISIYCAGINRGFTFDGLRPIFADYNGYVCCIARDRNTMIFGGGFLVTTNKVTATSLNEYLEFSFQLGDFRGYNFLP